MRKWMFIFFLSVFLLSPVVTAGAVETNSISQYSSSPDDTKDVDETYYTTDRKIVLEDAYNTNFEIRVLEDGTGKEQFFKNVSNYYISKGTWIVTAKDKWHQVQSDTLSIAKIANTNNQLLTMKCDTLGITPYLKVNKFSARAGYTLTEFDIKRENSETTKSSSGGSITSSVPEDEVLTVGDNFDVYIGAKSNISKITFIWTPNTYTVKYNANGGTGTMADTIITYDKSTAIRANTFTREGHTFKGWHVYRKSDNKWLYKNGSTNGWYEEGKEPEGYVKVYYSDKTKIATTSPVDKDVVTLYAQWAANSFTVKYNANGGTGTMSDTIITYGTSTALRANTFTRAGYTFSGWYVYRKSDNKWFYKNGTSRGWYEEGSEPAGYTKVYYSDKTNIATTSAVENDIVTMYAQWRKVDTYMIKVNPNGGKFAGTTEDTSYTGLTSGTVKNIANPTKTGYVFIGWKYSDYKNIPQIIQPVTGYTYVYGGARNGSTYGDGTVSASTTTVTAYEEYTNYKWSGLNATEDYWNYLSFNTYSVSAGETVTVEGYIRINSCPVWLSFFHGEKPNDNQNNKWTAKTTNGQWQYFSFERKFTSASSTAMLQLYTSNLKNITGNIDFDLKGIKITKGDGTVLPAVVTVENRDIILTAQWEPVQYTITYNANGGTGSMSASTHIYDTAKNLTANSFTKTGYTFKGWNTKADGSGTSYKNKASVKNLSATNGENITLYAQWTNQLYTIAFNSNGGNGTMVDMTDCVYDVSYTLAENAFTKTGYKFVGWATTSTGAVKYVDKASVSKLTSTANGKVTLYAKWEPITYTVVYDAGEGIGSMTSSTHTYDKAEALNANKFTKTGYTFLEWQGSTEEQSFTFSDRESVINLTAEDGATITLTAKWLGKKTTTTFYRNTSSNDLTSEKTVFFYDVKNQFFPDLNEEWTKEGYTLTGWLTSKDATIAAYGVNYVATNSYIESNYPSNSLYAQWNANTYTNRIGHWAWGFQNQEGNNSKKDAFKLIDTTFEVDYDTSFILNGNDATRIPNGFYLYNKFKELYVNDDIWTNTNHNLGARITQLANDMIFEYDYYPYTYTITYNMNGGTNSSSNPDTYNVLYGVTLEEPTKTGYTFAGWYNGSTKITGINEGCNATFSSVSDMYTKLEERTTGNLVLTAKWDKYPEITSYDRYFTLEQAQNGEITEEELLKRVKAEDLEDGVLVNGIQVTVKNYNVSDFMSLTTEKNMDVTYQATDSFGNVVTETVVITIVDTEMKESIVKKYARFISPQFYADETGSLINESDGGLEETSIWRTEPDYSDLLKNTLSASKTNVETWNFDQKALKKMKDYTKAYGYTLNALEEFYELFSDCMKE